MINLLFSALLLGLIGGAIPGPVLTAIFTEILQSGFAKSLRIIFQAMFSETVVALVTLIILSSLHLSESIFHGLSVVGAMILFWMATSIWKINKIDAKQKIHLNFWKISAMIVANGLLWSFWITVCVPKAIELNNVVNFGSLLFLLLVELGWLCSTVFIAFLFSRFRALLTKPKVIPITFKVFALAFVYFAVDMLYKSAVFFFK